MPGVGIRDEDGKRGSEGHQSKEKHAPNALMHHDQEGVERVFRRKKQALQAFGYSLLPLGKVCTRDDKGGSSKTEL